MDRIRRLIAEIESALNVTVKRITLKEALEGELPEIVPSGEKLYISYADILDLAKIVPEEKYDEVLLPIVLIRRIDLGPGVFVYSKEDSRIISKLLGEERKYLSKPEVLEIASKYPSLIHIIILGTDYNEGHRAQGISD